MDFSDLNFVASVVGSMQAVHSVGNSISNAYFRKRERKVESAENYRNDYSEDFRKGRAGYFVRNRNVEVKEYLTGKLMDVEC